jgi:hypothetical protein
MAVAPATTIATTIQRSFTGAEPSTSRAARR